jgi:hypothetical protein
VKKTTTTKTATKIKSTRTKKRAAKPAKARAKRSPAAKVIAPDFDAKTFAKAVEGTTPLKTTKRGPRPPKRTPLNIAAAKLGRAAGKIARVVGEKKRSSRRS